MSKKNIIHINSKKEMVELATKIANEAKRGDIYLLKGSLGVGKTFFAKVFIDSLLEDSSEIPSPTFNLLKTYDTKKGKVYHFDLYRIKDSEELYELGIEDALEDGICLIEWPELAYDFVGDSYYEIEISIDNNNSKNIEKRTIIIKKIK